MKKFLSVLLFILSFSSFSLATNTGLPSLETKENFESDSTNNSRINFIENLSENLSKLGSDFKSIAKQKISLFKAFNEKYKNKLWFRGVKVAGKAGASLAGLYLLFLNKLNLSFPVWIVADLLTMNLIHNSWFVKKRSVEDSKSELPEETESVSTESHSKDLSSIIANGKIVKALRNAEITTVENLIEKYNSKFDFTKINGIGEKYASEINSCVESFLSNK